MKRVVVLAVMVMFAFGLFMGASPKCAYAKEYKIGYVDFTKVFDEYKKTKDAEKEWADKSKAKDAERKTLIDELRSLKDAQNLLSDKAKAEKQTVIDAKIKNLQEFDRVTRDDLVKQRNDLLSGILKNVDKVISDYAKQNGYDFILNSRMMLYGAEQYDVTNDILTKLNK